MQSNFPETVRSIVAREKRSAYTRRLVIAALMIALSVIINSLRVGPFSFGGFPIIFSGLLLGPLTGFVVGAVADILAFIVRPSSSGFNPVFVLTSALTGFIPSLLVGVAGDVYPRYRWWKVFLGMAVGQLITTVLMSPFFVVLFYTGLWGTEGFWPAFFLRSGKALLRQAYNVPMYSVLFLVLVKALKKAFPEDFFRRRPWDRSETKKGLGKSD